MPYGLQGRIRRCGGLILDELVTSENLRRMPFQHRPHRSPHPVRHAKPTSASIGHKLALLSCVRNSCPVCKTPFAARGKPKGPDSLVWDKLDPKGEEKDGNVVPLCAGCVRRRGGKALVDWIPSSAAILERVLQSAS